VVDDDVDATAVGLGQYPVGEVLLLVVEDVVRTEFAGVLQFLLAGTGGVHLSAAVDGDLEGRVADAA
jgi:hypothetical protein